jgi:DNA-binding transcriptional LysR family regulator
MGQHAPAPAAPARELKRRGILAAVATALSYAPSSVSQQLSQLETEVGVTLLEPVGRRVRLTAQAEILVALTEAVLERLERAEADVAASLTDLTGALHIASFQPAARRTPAGRSARRPPAPRPAGAVRRDGRHRADGQRCAPSRTTPG